MRGGTIFIGLAALIGAALLLRKSREHVSDETSNPHWLPATGFNSLTVADCCGVGLCAEYRAGAAVLVPTPFHERPNTTEAQQDHA